jgi:hypothetical protein
MASTPYMNLNLPTPTVTLGPAWAQELNLALSAVDSHDHSPGKGKQLSPDSINVNKDFPFNNHNLALVRSTRYVSNVNTLSDPADVNSVYVVGGDLFYNNSAGIPVQITSGTSLSAVTDGISRSLETKAVSSNTTILSSDTTSYFEVDASGGAVQLTLPPAAAVAPGRFYEVKDIKSIASTNNISIAPNGADTIDNLNAPYVLNINNQSTRVVSDGVSGWFTQFIAVPDDSVTTLKVRNNAITNAKVADNAISTTKIQDGSVTPVKLAAKTIASTAGGNFSTPSSSMNSITSVSITTTGKPVVIQLQPWTPTANAYIGITATSSTLNLHEASLEIRRGNSIIFKTPLRMMEGVGPGLTPKLWQATIPLTSVNVIDQPTAGTYFYSVWIGECNSGTSVQLENYKLIAYEV